MKNGGKNKSVAFIILVSVYDVTSGCTVDSFGSQHRLYSDPGVREHFELVLMCVFSVCWFLTLREKKSVRF